MNVSFSRLAFITSVSASLFACGDSAPAPEEVRTDVAQSLAALLPEIEGAVNSDAVGRLPVEEATRVFDLINGRGATAVLAARPALRQLAATAPLEADKLSAMLNQHLFSDANHQGDGIYPLPASLLCATSLDPETGEPSVELDVDCTQMLAKVQPKIKVRGDRTSLDFSLLIGPNEREPLSLALSRTKVELGFDLGETAQAAQDLAKVLEAQAPNLRADGRVTLGLEVKGAKHLVVRGAITDAIDLVFAAPGVSLDSAEAFRFSSAAAPVISFELDGVAQQLIATLGLGETKAHVPADGSDPMIDLDLPGLTGAIDLKPGAPLAFTGLGLGKRALTVDANGQRAVTINLNATAGRAFDATVSETAGQLSFAVSPSLDLELAVDAAALGDVVEPYQVTRIQLDGTSPTLALIGDQLKVTSGRFAVTTDPAQYGVDAAAGQCLQEGLTGTVSHLMLATCSL